MYPREILKHLTYLQIVDISKLLENFFPLVDKDRIFQLILQVDSVDRAIELLFIHKECTFTLDHIVFDYLRGQDEKVF
jgi:hypothetical protein